MAVYFFLRRFLTSPFRRFCRRAITAALADFRGSLIDGWTVEIVTLGVGGLIYGESGMVSSSGATMS